jgi:hypothetical protein
VVIRQKYPQIAHLAISLGWRLDIPESFRLLRLRGCTFCRARSRVGTTGRSYSAKLKSQHISNVSSAGTQPLVRQRTVEQLGDKNEFDAALLAKPFVGALNLIVTRP